MRTIASVCCGRWGVIALSAVALASCTTYRPLDGGSQVPWAAQVQALRAAPVVEARRAQPVSLQPGAGGSRIARAPVAVTPVPELAQAPAPSPKAAPAAVAPAPAARVEVAPVMAAPARTAPAEVAPAAPAVTASAPESGQPTPAQHRVARGERLGGVARAYGVSLPALAQANDLAPPYLIYVGQVLQIPSGATAEPRRYVVRSGDTLSSIADHFEMAMRDVAAANRIASPYRLEVGQVLEIPGVQTAQAVPDAAPPPLTGDGFLWPVSGKVIGGFGAAGDGQRHNGINIAARKGAPVVAAEDGVVVYADDGIHGYGRMVLVRHAEGYITTYAHNAALLVDVGDVVRRGQVIARVGDTGDVSQSQLHFELRRGTKPINPEDVLVREPTTIASTSTS